MGSAAHHHVALTLESSGVGGGVPGRVRDRETLRERGPAGAHAADTGCPQGCVCAVWRRGAARALTDSD